MVESVVAFAVGCQAPGFGKQYKGEASCRSGEIGTGDACGSR